MVVKGNLYKTTIVFFVISILLLLGGCSLSKDSNLKTYSIKNNSYCELIKFTGKYSQGKVYLNWIVNTNISNYYFVLEKTNDGSTYTVIHTVKGFTSPIPQGILFSFIDCNLKHTSRTYRLRAVQPIKNGQEILLYADGKNLFKDCKNAVISVENTSTTSANR
jgi:hypothetical protein